MAKKEAQFSFSCKSIQNKRPELWIRLNFTFPRVSNWIWRQKTLEQQSHTSIIWHQNPKLFLMACYIPYSNIIARYNQHEGIRFGNDCFVPSLPSLLSSHFLRIYQSTTYSTVRTVVPRMLRQAEEPFSSFHPSIVTHILLEGEEEEKERGWLSDSDFAAYSSKACLVYVTLLCYVSPITKWSSQAKYIHPTHLSRIPDFLFCFKAYLTPNPCTFLYFVLCTYMYLLYLYMNEWSCVCVCEWEYELSFNLFVCVWLPPNP